MIPFMWIMRFVAAAGLVWLALLAALAVLKKTAPEFYRRHVVAAFPATLPARCFDCSESDCSGCPRVEVEFRKLAN